VPSETDALPAIPFVPEEGATTVGRVARHDNDSGNLPQRGDQSVPPDDSVTIAGGMYAAVGDELIVAKRHADEQPDGRLKNVSSVADPDDGETVKHSHRRHDVGEAPLAGSSTSSVVAGRHRRRY